MTPEVLQTLMSPITSLLDSAPDLHGEEWGDAAAPPRLAVVPKRSLRDRISTVEYIADTIESMDDSEMSEQVRTALSEALVTELAGTRAKVDSTCAVLAMWDGYEASALKEIERLKARAQKFARMRDRLEAHVEAVMVASNLDRIDGDTNTIAIRKNPPSVRIDVEPAALPSEYLRYSAPPPPPPPVPDKAALKRALSAGVKIDGVTLVQSVRLVRS